MRPFIEAPGKAMIVCATREICANLYSAIVALRSGWHSGDLDKGRIKVVYRVNRTFRGKEDGLLVADAPLADNLQKALSEYTQEDQEHQPLGRNVEEAVALTETLVANLRVLLAGYDWKATLNAGGARPFIRAAAATVDYLRDPATPGNQVPDGEETLAARYRRLSGQLARAWAICGGTGTLPTLHPEVRFYEEVRVWMAKFDAEDRQSRGEPIPEEIQRLLGKLIAESTASGDVVDIYDAAGMPKPTLTDLNPDFVAKTQQARNPHLAIEALRKLLNEESTKATRNNVVRQRAFSERLTELMNRYTNQQLTSAEVIAELVELAREVAAEAGRGERFSPPLGVDELAFFDAVAQNESAVAEQGEGVLADIARSWCR